MERNLNSLIGYRIKATDGEIGEVVDFYFDDETWTIRYLIVKTGNWFSGRKVLVSIAALSHKEISGGLLPVNITQEQIQQSPDIDTDKPVSRQQEAMLNQHHIWQNYWGSGSYGGQMGIENNRPVRIKAIDQDPAEDIHLRSIADVSGYAIHALDGEIGHVNGFIVDDQSWQLASLVVDTHNWIGGKKVLIPVAQVHSVSFLDWVVYVDITVADIDASKLYKEAEYNQEA